MTKPSESLLKSWIACSQEDNLHILGGDCAALPLPCQSLSEGQTGNNPNMAHHHAQADQPVLAKPACFLVYQISQICQSDGLIADPFLDYRYLYHTVDNSDQLTGLHPQNLIQITAKFWCTDSPA